MPTNSATGRTAYAILSPLIGARVEVASMNGATGVISGALMNRYTPKFVVLLDTGDVMELTAKVIKVVDPAATMASIARYGKALGTPWLATPKSEPAATKTSPATTKPCPAAKSKLSPAAILAAAMSGN